MMTRLLMAALAAAAIGGIAVTAPASATPPCQVNWELKSDGQCHPYYSTPINGYDPYDPSGQGFLRGYGPDSSWEEASQPAPGPRTAPPAASPAQTNKSPTLPDADAQGFLDYPGARCNSTNLASAIARTAQSVVVICQTGVGRFYYRGFGLRNGQSVEIDDPLRSGAGFIATNNGVQYSVSPHAVTITQGSKVLSNEPTLEYWSQ